MQASGFAKPESHCALRTILQKSHVFAHARPAVALIKSSTWDQQNHTFLFADVLHKRARHVFLECCINFDRQPSLSSYKPRCLSWNKNNDATQSNVAITPMYTYACNRKCLAHILTGECVPKQSSLVMNTYTELVDQQRIVSRWRDSNTFNNQFGCC